MGSSSFIFSSPSDSSQGKPFGDEIRATLKFNARGIVAMANSGPDSNKSQFFITYAKQSHLDSKYTIFGRCVFSCVSGVYLHHPELSMEPTQPSTLSNASPSTKNTARYTKSNSTRLVFVSSARPTLTPSRSPFTPTQSQSPLSMHSPFCT